MLPLGKLAPELLSRLLSSYAGCKDERVIIGPKIGVDAAVIDMGDRYLIAKTDPITFVTQDMGWYCVNVNANDIASMGGTPQWLLVTILLPEDHADTGMAEGIFRSIHEACIEIGIAVCGGHTEVTHGIDRPLIIGQMLGQVDKEDLVTSSGAKEGDAVILTKGLALEATSIIAREKRDDLLQKGYSEEYIKKCSDYLHTPGISVLKEAQIACSAGTVHAMHDPTEGGVAAGLWEIAFASCKGIEVLEEMLFASEETAALCREYSIDPLGAISSGALLICVPENESDTVVSTLADGGIACKVAGYVREKGFGIKIRTRGKLKDLHVSPSDEIRKLFS